jgi:hypothetical protein
VWEVDVWSGKGGKVCGELRFGMDKGKVCGELRFGMDKGKVLPLFGAAKSGCMW